MERLIHLSETSNSFLESFPGNRTSASSHHALLDAVQHRYLKDSKLNLVAVLRPGVLDEREILAILYATALNENQFGYAESLVDLLYEKGYSESDLGDLISAVSLMKINNTFYRFRHFMKDSFYDAYPAGIKMSVMLAPGIGKELFELVSLVVSSLNACEMCVKAHEQSLLTLGVRKEKIVESVRLASVLKGSLWLTTTS